MFGKTNTTQTTPESVGAKLTMDEYNQAVMVINALNHNNGIVIVDEYQRTVVQKALLKLAFASSSNSDTQLDEFEFGMLASMMPYIATGMYIPSMSTYVDSVTRNVSNKLDILLSRSTQEF